MVELPGPLVSPDWLEANLSQVRVVDVGWSIEQGPHLDRYRSRHIPGAVFCDLDADLSAPPGTRGRHPLPTPDDFATARARLGAGRLPVVAYDDRGGPTAARLWWMLDAIGHPVAVLDGGLANWHGALDAGESESFTDSVDPVPWPADRFIPVGDVLDAVDDGALVLDARSAERFAGADNPIDKRPGHIPGSVSRPWTDNVDDGGRFRSSHQLRADFEGLGATEETSLVASCGSGVTACHDLLAARIAGFPPGRLYVGSWSEWSQDPDRPVATDRDGA
ncbi:MAG: sulfurtransferase [Actinomycetota bacterium]